MAALNSEQQSAYNLMYEMLKQYGLESLSAELQTLVQEETDQDVLMYRLRQTEAYNNRFPAMKELNQRGIPFSEGDYFNYEIRAKQLEAQYDLPAGMLTSPDKVSGMLLNYIDADALTRRVELNYASSLNAPQEVKDELQRLYGIGQGGVAAFYLDPDNAQSTLEQVAATTAISAEGRRQGFTLDREQAERYQALGYQQNSARQSFEAAGALVGLSSGTYAVDQKDLVDAAFGDAKAQQAVERTQKSRTGQFADAGGAAAGQEGITGLGVK